MKIISLNVWGGKIKEPLRDFFKKYSGRVDIFCLQEVFHNGKTSLEVFSDGNMNLFNDVREILPKFKGCYHPTQTNEEGLSLFVRDTIKTNEVGDAFVFRWRDAMENGDTKTLGRNLQYISVEQDGKKYLVANFHGLWNGMGKFDTEDRLGQSHKIKDFLDARNEDYKIIVGDFNLLPDTKSLKILEGGMRNLIKEYSVTSTRTSFYKKSERLADYILTSPNLIVKKFEVLSDEVSDHSALLLEI